MTNLSKTPQTLAKVEKLTLESKEVLATTVETERGNTIQTTQLKPGLKEEFQKEEKAVEAKQNAPKGPAPRAK